MISKLKSGKIASFCIEVLMVLLLAVFIVIGWVKLLGRARSAGKEIKAIMIFLGALTIVDSLYMKIIKLHNLYK
jgi:hypothetical protein